MTIQVCMKHGEAGMPAPFYVTPVSIDAVGNRVLGRTACIKDRQSFTLYVHAHQDILITERPPEGSQ